MRRAWLLGFVAGCGAPDAIVVELDAEPVVLASLETLEVTISGGPRAPEHFEVALRDAPPDCLPLTFAVTRGDADRFELEIVGNPADATARIEQHVEATFAPGLRMLPILLDAACVRPDGCAPLVADALESTTAAEVDARVRGQVCRELPSALECIDGGGCFDRVAPDAPGCLLACPALERPAEPDPPAAPMPPAAVVVGTCPSGWVEDGGACVPWLADAPACAAGTFRFPGDGTCEALAPCDATWPSDAPVDAVYVEPGANGDGSAGAPVGTIADALTRGAKGGTIVLSAGLHSVAANLAIDRDVTIRGACAATTRLSAAIAPSSAEVTIERVTLVGLAATGGSVTLRNVIAEGDVRATGADVILDRVAIPSADLAFDTSAVALDRVAIGGAIDLVASNVTGGALFATGGLDVDAESTWMVDRTLFEATGAAASGAMIGTHVVWRDVTGSALDAEGARIELDHAVIRGVQGAGLEQVGGTLRLTDSRIEDITTSASQDAGGVFVTNVETIAERVVIRDVGAWGLRTESGSTTLTDFVVGRTTGSRRLSLGIGLWSTTSTLTVTRGAIEDVYRFGVLVEGGPATFDDLSIVGVRPEQQEQERGQGLYATGGAHVTATRLHIEGARDSGIRVNSEAAPGTRADFVDVTVVDTTANGDPVTRDRGVGLYVTGAASRATVLRGVFSRNRHANIQIVSGEATLDHVFVSDGVPKIEALGTPPEDVEIGGFGLLVELTAKVVAHRFHAARSRDAAVLVRYEDNDVTLEDVILEGATVAGDALGYNLFGGGLAVGLGGRAKMVRFHIDDNAGAGIRIFDGGQLGYAAPNVDLEDGVVSNNAVGALVQAKAYETQRIGVRVLYRDNADAIVTIAED